MDFNKHVQDKAPETTQKKEQQSNASAPVVGESENPLLQMCGAMGNRGTAQLVSETVQLKSHQSFGALIQRLEEEEEPIQGFEEEEPIQGVEEPEEELLQGKSEETVQQKPNKTGMPDNLKAGVENLSGMDMSDVKVNYNSNKPEEVGALAYTQGNNIHVAPGQEKHLAHEAWHVAQQRDGRVQPTTEVNGASVNDDPALEKEADVMGAKALQMANQDEASPIQTKVATVNDDPALEKEADVMGEKVLQKVAQFMEAEPFQRMPIQMKSALQTEIEKVTGEGATDKSAIFNAFMSVLKDKGFKYNAALTVDVKENMSGPANCGSLVTALREIFESMTGDKVGRDVKYKIYTEIPSTFVDPTAEGNVKDTSGGNVNAYYFNLHSFLKGFDPTSGIVGPSYEEGTFKKLDTLFDLLDGERVHYDTMENYGNYQSYTLFGDFIILKDKDDGPRMYTRVNKGNLLEGLTQLGVIKMRQP